jgi:hypothetical protein
LPRFEVAPVTGYHDSLLSEFNDLPLACADGLDTMIGRMDHRDPNPKERCGLIADRHELYAVTLPGCDDRAMIMTIDIAAPGRPRAIHGTLPLDPRTNENGRRVAVSQLNLINPSWEASR